MKKELLIFFLLVIASLCLHLNENHDGVDLPGGTVAIMADNGEYLNVCHNCGDATNPDSASLSSTLQTWTLEVVGSKVAFKGSNGKYLARCDSCWRSAKYNMAVFVHATSTQPYALWTPILRPNGKYAFQADNLKYLARCQNCVFGNTHPNFAFVHSYNITSWTQWDIIYTDIPSLGVHTLRADNGGYMKYCPNAGVSNAVCRRWN